MGKKPKDQPWLLIIAGPNGAGKTTFYNQVLKDNHFYKNKPYVNMDLIAERMADGNIDHVSEHMTDAARETSNKIQNLLKNKKTFIYETTSSGKTHLKIMANAREQGYKIAVVFVGLSKVELSHMRVQQRVENGGHDVKSEDIDRRYPKIIAGIPELMKRADIGAVFDNSGKSPFKMIFLMDESKLWVFHKYPNWVENSLKDRKTNKSFIHITNKEFKKYTPDKMNKLIDIFSGRNQQIR